MIKSFRYFYYVFFQEFWRFVRTFVLAMEIYCEQKAKEYNEIRVK